MVFGLRHGSLGIPAGDDEHVLGLCQSLRTTSHWNVSPELIAIVSTTPGLGMESTSICLLNRMSLLLMVSRVSVSSLRTRRDGILRLISTVCGMCSSAKQRAYRERAFPDGTIDFGCRSLRSTVSRWLLAIFPF